MAGNDDAENGASEGTHAPEIVAEPGRAAKVGVTAASVEAAIGDLAAAMVSPAAESQASLMLDEMDEQMALFSGPVKHVADQRLAARGRGRPKGSPNKNSFRDVALRMGYRHPGLNLLDLANADPEALARELSTEKAAAMSLIVKANEALMPYFEGKAAQQLEVNIKQLGVMVFEAIPGQLAADDDVLDLTSFPNPE